MHASCHVSRHVTYHVITWVGGDIASPHCHIQMSSHGTYERFMSRMMMHQSHATCARVMSNHVTYDAIMCVGGDIPSPNCNTHTIYRKYACVMSHMMIPQSHGTYSWVMSHITSLRVSATFHLSTVIYIFQLLYTDESWHIFMSHVPYNVITCVGDIPSFNCYIHLSTVIYRRVMAHTNASCHIWWSFTIVAHMNESCHVQVMYHDEALIPITVYRRVMAHTLGSCHIRVSHVIYEGVMSHMSESCHIRDVSHGGAHSNHRLHMSHATYSWVVSHMSESYEWVMSHINEFMSNMSESCHTWVSHVA